jgi:hypothetical protein
LVKYEPSNCRKYTDCALKKLFGEIYEWSKVVSIEMFPFKLPTLRSGF